jgi:hypothetical protein
VRRAVARALFYCIVSLLLLAACRADPGTLASTPQPSHPLRRAHEVSPRSIAHRCPEAPAFDPGPEGAIAYAADRSLHLLELSSGRDRVLVPKGETPAVGWPVSFSHDGRWVAFGQGLVVPSAGGRVCTPLGRRGPPKYASTYSWRWLPGRDVLIGETLRGGLIEASMDGRARRLPIRMDSWALDTSGRYIAYGYSPHAPRIQQIRVYDLITGSRRIIYRRPPRRIAPPRVAGWSPDGTWVLFWPYLENSASLAADGLPLLAVSRDTDATARITRTMLPYESFITWCGSSLVTAVGGDRYVTDGKRVILAVPQAWRPRVLTTDRSRSWYRPACSPDGSRIALVSTRCGWEPRFNAWDRSLWILLPGGDTLQELLAARGFSYENPTWSEDGESVLVVRRESKPRARASLCLASVERPGSCAEVADLGRVGFGYYGINTYGLDWYQPHS